MMELTGWSRATCSQLYNGDQDYSPKVVNEAARALHAEPWELLMHPDRAMALRQMRASAGTIATLEVDNTPRIASVKDGTNG